MVVLRRVIVVKIVVMFDETQPSTASKFTEMSVSQYTTRIAEYLLQVIIVYC